MVVKNREALTLLSGQLLPISLPDTPAGWAFADFIVAEWLRRLAEREAA